MKVSVIGTGYVGLVSGTCFAEIGHSVTCIDVVSEKIQMLKSGKSPIYEPGLNDLLERNIQAERLQFSTDYSSCQEAEAIFLAVGTPSTDSGQADLKYLKEAAESAAVHLSNDAIVVIKSTVPVGTGNSIREFIASKTNKKFYLVNNPEFLKEGSAVEDFMRPDRVIIGSNDKYARKKMDELYAPLVRQGNPIYHMSNFSAEVTKYAANCFLATKISFINEIAKFCDLTGADIEEVRKGISTDRRIGRHFLYPGPGYGGACFPKDIKALMFTAKELGMELKIVQATENVNKAQKVCMYEKISHFFQGDLKGRVFAFWGVAFKANTDDVRGSAAIDMAKALIQAGAQVRFYDPVASHNYTSLMSQNPMCRGKIHQSSNMYDCLDECDGLVTMTEWREFRNPDFKALEKRLKVPVIFDARNLFETKRVLDYGFDYRAIGKKIPH